MGIERNRMGTETPFMTMSENTLRNIKCDQQNNSMQYIYSIDESSYIFIFSESKDSL